MKAITSKFTKGWSKAGRPGSGCWLLAAAACLLFSGCLPASLSQAQPDLTRYYLLNAVGPGAEGRAAAAAKRWTLGIRSVELPAYLVPKSFAIRTGANEVRYLDFTCWGEPLNQGIARVLAEDLRLQENVAWVAVQPFRPDETSDFEVLVRVTACDGTPDGGVQFAADWRLVRRADLTPAAAGTFAATGLHWDGRDYGQLAARLSEAVAGLSREIGAALPHGSEK